MIKRFSIFFLVVLIASACGDGVPYGVLSKKEMEEVMWDASLAGEFQNSVVAIKYPGLNRAAVSNKLLDRVLEMHKISRQKFDKSISYYESNPKTLTVILDTIAARQSRTISREQEAKRKADSIRQKQDSTRLKTDSSNKKADSAGISMSAGPKPPADTVSKAKAPAAKTVLRKKKRRTRTRK